MSRDECVEGLHYLNPGLSVAYLETLSEEQLRAYYVHLRAIRIMRLNDLAWLRAGAQACTAQQGEGSAGRQTQTAALSVA
jgi:hypothetical protein